MRFMLLLLLPISACVTSQPETWENHGTGKMVCLRYEQEECGLRLWKCGPDHSVEFECLTDAVYLGPGDHLDTKSIVKKERPTMPADYAPTAQEKVK
jgi:hypothetical protein